MTKNNPANQFSKSAFIAPVLYNQKFWTEKEKEFSDFIDKCVAAQNRDEAKKAIQDFTYKGNDINMTRGGMYGATTALSLAVSKFKNHAVEELLAAGADMHKSCYYGFGGGSIFQNALDMALNSGEISTFKILLENDKNESAVNGKNEDGNNPPIEILLKFNQELTSELRKKMKKMLGESEPIAADFHEKGSSSNEEQNVSSVDGERKDKLSSNKSDPEVPPAEQEYNNNKQRPLLPSNSGPIKLRFKRKRFPTQLVSKDDIGLNYS